MKLLALLTCLAVCAAPLQEKPASLPATEAAKLRSLFTEALAKDEPKTRAALIAQGKKLAAKYAFDDLIETLRAGPLLEKSPKPRKGAAELHKFGETTVGYTFSCEAGVFRYAVDVPPGYDPTRPAPVLLDPGHGTGAGKSDQEKADFLTFYRGQCTQAGLDDWLIARTEILEQIGADGLEGQKPEDQIAGVFQLFWRDLASRFCIDPDRLYVTGLSQTGFWSWYLARASAGRYAGIAPMSSVTWQVDPYTPNFTNLPIFVLHGEKDTVCPVSQARGTSERLQRAGMNLKYVEVPGAGHDIATWSRLNEGLKWLAIQQRAKYPRHAAKAFETLVDPWCGSLCVDEIEAQGDGKAQTRPTANIEIEIQGQNVKLTSKGVKRATLYCARELLDVAKPIEVTWNGKRAFQGTPERNFVTALSVALDRADWTQTFECSIELRCP
ncbi:MAG: prolyl oligopeptidase family serine peptidase [Planctomycetota bacterium]